jgi:hypothetical protein
VEPKFITFAEAEEGAELAVKGVEDAGADGDGDGKLDDAVGCCGLLIQVTAISTIAPTIATMIGTSQGCLSLESFSDITVFSPSHSYNVLMLSIL